MTALVLEVPPGGENLTPPYTSGLMHVSCSCRCCLMVCLDISPTLGVWKLAKTLIRQGQKCAVRGLDVALLPKEDDLVPWCRLSPKSEALAGRAVGQLPPPRCPCRQRRTPTATSAALPPCCHRCRCCAAAKLLPPPLPLPLPCCCCVPSRVGATADPVLLPRPSWPLLPPPPPLPPPPRCSPLPLPLPSCCRCAVAALLPLHRRPHRLLPRCHCRRHAAATTNTALPLPLLPRCIQNAAAAAFVFIFVIVPVIIADSIAVAASAFS